MATNTDNVFYVLHDGAVQEEPEPLSWNEIVELCEAGQLSPKTRIFIPGENAWHAAIDTPLAPYFERQAVGDHHGPDAIAERQAEYEQLKRQIDTSDGDPNRMVQAAELALALGDRRAALEHFQQALDISPYQPRVVRAARKQLTAEEREELRFFDRPAAIWDDLPALIKYPIGRGPYYLAAATAVVSALLWVPWMRFIVGPLLFLWATRVVSTAASGDHKLPHWKVLISNPRSWLGPCTVALIVGLELYLPFLVFAQIASVIGSGDSNVLAFIQKSPIMIVIMATATLIYVPAAFIMAGVSGDPRAVADPRRVLTALAKMELEYVASIAFIGAFIAVWGIADLAFSAIPIASRVLTCAFGIYALLTGAFVVGRLQARFSEELTNRVAPRLRSGAEELPDSEDSF